MRRDQLLLLILLTFAQYTQGAENRSILIYGDSVSAGYGMTQPESWPALLASDLAFSQPSVSFTNASVSGETTTGGLNRFKKALEIHAPDLGILELGGNDGLRGYPISKIQANLGNMIALCQKQGIEILLIGMVLPPNYGRRYTIAFAAVYDQLADETDTVLIPFQLEDLAITERMIQQDGLHPTEKAQLAIKAVVAQIRKPLVQP